MKRSDWYFIGLMICTSNVNVFGAVTAMLVMLIMYWNIENEENEENTEGGDE